MLRRTPKKPEEPVKREPFTYVHRGTTIVGRVEAVGRVRVHGVVRGDVEVEGVVEVAPAGVIEGSVVRAEELRVLGTVRADVVVSGKVELWNGGVLVGDVRAAALDIEEGARFTGRSVMTGPDGQPLLPEPVAGVEAPAKLGPASPDAQAEPRHAAGGADAAAEGSAEGLSAGE